MTEPSTRSARGATSWRARALGACALDEGYAVVLVIGTIAVLALVLPLLLAGALRDLGDSKRHHGFDAAQDAARSGVQSVIAQLATNPSFSVGPSVPDDVAGAGWASPAAQYAWARSALLASAASGAVSASSAGRWTVVRPPNQRVIYALGWPLAGTAVAQGKVVVAEFTFAQSAPGPALLAGSEIRLSGSFNLNPAPGVTLSADLHTNGNLTGTASSPVVTGSMTATGTASYPNATAGAPARTIPAADPRAFYAAYATGNAASWFDLCPDGRARRPGTSGVPCSGPVVPTPSSWTASGSDWQEGYPGGPPGIYYVYGGNAVIGTGSTTVTQTIVTEATQAGAGGASANLQCPKGSTGSITVTKTTVRAFLPGTVLLSGNTVEIGSQGATFGGLVAAQESVQMSSSSSPGISGYVIAQNYCSGEVNTFQGSTIAYDPSSGYLAPGPPRITAEAELAAS
jgi:hypothetical protein